MLGPASSEEEIKALIDKHGLIFIKPVFKGGIGKKGKAGLLGRATDLKTALAEKERLYFAEHQVGHLTAKANGVTFEAGVPAEHEVYFSISDSTHFRAPTMTLTHMGGMDIEELDKSQVAMVPFDPLTGLKAFVVANALTEIGAPKEIISPLVQQLPKLWELFHDFGMTTLELNPIRMREDKTGAADAGGLRLQVRLRPRRSALAAPELAGAPVRGRLLRLRAGDQHAAHAPGPERRVRDQRQGHGARADLRRRRQLAGDRDAGRRRDHQLRLRRQSARTRR